MAAHVERAERREVGGQVGRDQLEDLLGAGKILEPIPPELAQRHTVGQLVLDQLCRG